MLWQSPNRLMSELPGQSGPSSARSFGQLRANSCHRRADLPFISARFWLDQVSPVGTMAAVSTIKTTLFSGARVQCNTPFGTVKP
jgi:hypothetical protein